MAGRREKFRPPGSDDPLSLAQNELEDRPQPEERPRRSWRAPSQPKPQQHHDFPPCPPERTERTWRLVRLFIETGKAYGRTRVVSPWQLAEDLVTKIKHDQQIWAFIRQHGNDLTEDLLGRMIRIYWQHYVDEHMTRNAIVNQFIDDYWTDLWDQAKTQYATDEIQRLDAAGQLKTVPGNQYGSLANDTDYRNALQELRVEERLRSQLLDPNHQLESGNDQPQS
jgi:hypothetical protein